MLTFVFPWKPNARHELRLEAGATQERTLEAVSSMPLLGPAPMLGVGETVPDTSSLPLLSISHRYWKASPFASRRRLGARDLGHSEIGMVRIWQECAA
jgi:hypothetical protein